MAESHEYNIPAAKAALALLRLYKGTRSLPDKMRPSDLKTMASSYTGNVYKAGNKGIDTAISDLAKWLKGKE